MILHEWAKGKARQLGLKAQVRQEDLLPPGFDAKAWLREVRAKPR